MVGADGKHSGIAAAMGAKAYLAHPATTCVYYTFFQDFDAPHTRIFVREGQFAVALPTNSGLTNLAIMWPAHEFARVRGNIEAAFNAAAAKIPWIAERITQAKRVERFVGTADNDAFFRTACGPGWALLGDAGYHRDPITAQGMTDAFHHSEFLAEAITAGFSGAEPLESALAGYQSRRDAAVMPMFEMTCDLARLAPPQPEMAALFEALVGNELATEKFLGVMAGTVGVADFFAPANIGAIIGARKAA